MKIAVVTGASSGMGREFVLALAEKESFDEIWVIARRKEKLCALAKEVRVPLRVLSMDLTDPASFDVYAALLAEEKPEIAVLVNCSGYGKFGSCEEIGLQECLGMIDLNCKALVSMTMLSLPYMKRGGKIAEVDSLSAFQPVPYLTVYGASKAFVLQYSRALNTELRGRGISVMAVCPGWVKTAFFDRAEKRENPVVTYFNAVYEAKDVVRTAVRDLYRGKKDVSIHGFSVKAQVLLVKLLPHRLVMQTWLKQQKLPR